MPNTGTGLTNKGLPYFLLSEIGLGNPDIQGWFQNFATAANARVSVPAAVYKTAVATVGSATYADPSDGGDKVTVACPTDGLLIAGYSSLWKVSAAATIAAAFFIGPTGGTQTQLKLPNPASGGAPVVQEATLSPGAATNYGYLHSNRQGLGAILPGATDNTLVTTGLVLASPSGAQDGGLCYIFPGTADTFDVAVKYKNSAGTLSVKERRLWVWSVEYL
jgi:hypothetical protein